MDVSISILALLLCGLGSACGEDEYVAQAKRTSKIDLVPVAGLGSLEARLVERGHVWRDRTCLRPALRSTTTPGSGVMEIDDLFWADAVVSGCVEVVDEIEGLGPDTFEWDGFLATGSGIPQVLLRRLHEHCTPALEAISDAISYEDVCSPWRPGVRANPPDREVVHRLSRARVLLDRAAYEPGTALDSMRNALDLIRFQQDLLRGGGSEAWVAHTVLPIRQDQGPWISWLLETGDLDDAALDEAVEGLSVLLDSEPTLGTLVAASGYRHFVQEWQPRLHGFFWAPPGGWDPGRPLQWGWVKRSRWFDEDSVKAITLLALEQHFDVLADACPEDCEVLECIHGLYALAPRDPDDEQPIPAEGQGDMARWGRALTGPDRKDIFREWYVDIVAREMDKQAWILVEALEQLSFRSLRLAQLRLHAAIIRSWRSSGRCPSSGELDSVEWRSLTLDPVFGGRLDVSFVPENEWVVRPTSSYTHNRVNGWGLAYRFHCPSTHSETLAAH